MAQYERNFPRLMNDQDMQETFISNDRLAYVLDITSVHSLPRLSYVEDLEERDTPTNPSISLFLDKPQEDIYAKTRLLTTIDATLTNLWRIPFEEKLHKNVIRQLIHTMYKSPDHQQELHDLFDTNPSLALQRVAKNAVAFINLSRHYEQTISHTLPFKTSLRRLIWRKDAEEVGRVLYGAKGYEQAQAFLHTQPSAIRRPIANAEQLAFV